MKAPIPAFEATNYALAAATAPTAIQEAEINRGDKKFVENESSKYQPH